MRPRSLAATLAVAVALVAGCSDVRTRTAAGYCEAVGAELDALVAPAIATPDDVELALERYRDLRDAAPVAVEEEWAQLVLSMETAATVDPADRASLQRAADTARATEPAAVRVQQYTEQTCSLSIGVVPPATNPVTATTLPPTTTTG